MREFDHGAVRTHFTDSHSGVRIPASKFASILERRNLHVKPIQKNFPDVVGTEYEVRVAALDY
jgi:hypothetical protein